MRSAAAVPVIGNMSEGCPLFFLYIHIISHFSQKRNGKTKKALNIALYFSAGMVYTNSAGGSDIPRSHTAHCIITPENLTEKETYEYKIITRLYYIGAA